MYRKFIALITFWLLASFILGACQPSSTEAPEQTEAPPAAETTEPEP